ncbi:MAG: slipin family protein [Coriobacteriia bacterium]|nr:slipin family protein [Coriobacteriia bacterium]MBS5478040.1 slipin family protein [Coriobacteriia bacterium]
MSRRKGEVSTHGDAAPGAQPAVVAGAFDRGAVLGAETTRRRASRNGAVAFSIVVFAAAFCLVLGLGALLVGGVGLAVLIAAFLAGCLAMSSVHIVLEWEKAVVLRFGRFNRVAGPGIVFTIPLVEFYTLRIDQRVSSTYFGAEETLTSDLVPVNADAVLFWMVWDAKRATVEVEDYAQAVAWVAQTSMRKAIGRRSIAEVATRREQLDEELKQEIEAKLNPWGISIVDVEIRDIVIPKELQQAMAQEAAAERRKNARMVLAEAEKDISEMLKDASDVYGDDPVAMKLRTMHLAYESVEESGGTLVLPSAFSEGFAPMSSEMPEDRTPKTKVQVRATAGDSQKKSSKV